MMAIRGVLAAAAIAASLFGLAACSSSSTSTNPAAEAQWQQDAKACDQIQDATQRQTCQTQAMAKYHAAIKQSWSSCPKNTC